MQTFGYHGKKCLKYVIMSLIAIYIFKIFCIHSFDWWTVCFHSDGLGCADSDWDGRTLRGNRGGDPPEIV